MLRHPGRILLLVALFLLLVGSASAGVLALMKGDDDATSRRVADRGAGHTAHPVAGDFKPDETRLAGCKDARCYEQAFGNIAYRQGPKFALELFDEKIRSDRLVESGCHRIAHAIGSAALARFKNNVAQAFAAGSSSCWSGYYHGILERAFTGASSKDDLGQVSRGLCADAQIRRTAWLAYQCVHGLGHGLMIHTGYNLPFSLEICDKLATRWDQTSCTGGVFMENISSSYGVRSRWLRDNDLIYPCNAIKERHKLYCYLMVTSRILQANGYDWKKTARTCAKAERAWVATCFQSYGRDASGFTRQDPVRIAKLCAIAGPRGQSECVYGAARDMTSNYADGRPTAKLCRLAPRALQGRCFNGIGTILGGINPTEPGRRAACRAVTKKYTRECLRGAGVRV